VQLWDLPGGKPLWTSLVLRGGGFWGVRFSPDGAQLEAASGNQAHLLTAATGREGLPVLQHPARLICVEYSPDGRFIVTTCWASDLSHDARLWEAATGKLLATMKHRDGIGTAAWSRDGRWVATGSEDLTARVWEVPSGQPRCSPIPHFALVRHVAFSPDSRLLATGCFDGTVRLWDCATGEPLGSPIKPVVPVEHWTEFLADGRSLLLWPVYRAAVPPTGPGRLLRLAGDRGRSEDWIHLAGLVSGHELDAYGAVAPLPANVLSNSWAAFLHADPPLLPPSTEAP